MTMGHAISGKASALALAAMLAACHNGDADRAPASENANAGAVPVSQPVPAAAPEARSIMQPEIAEPAPEPQPLEPVEVTIRFDDGGAGLDDAARLALDRIAGSREVASGGTIVLRGSTDSHGDDAMNRLVSAARAQAAADYLASKGIDKARMTVIALGEDRPVAPNARLDGSDDEEGRRRNRRVDITVTPGSATPDPRQADTAAANSSDASPPDTD